MSTQTAQQDMPGRGAWVGTGVSRYCPVPPSPVVPSQNLTRSATLVMSTQMWPALGVNPTSTVWSPEGVLLSPEGNGRLRDEPQPETRLPTLAQ